MSMPVLCTALLALLVFGLGFGVSMNRSQRAIGHEIDPTDKLHKWVRAHGNTCEYSPMLAILYLYLGDSDPPTWVISTIVLTTVARYLHAIGMVGFPTMAKPNPARFLGSLVTYVGGLALVVATLMTAVG